MDKLLRDKISNLCPDNDDFSRKGEGVRIFTNELSSRFSSRKVKRRVNEREEDAFSLTVPEIKVI